MLANTITYFTVSGQTLRFEPVSPLVITIQPPEKLVLEVRATGGYRFIQWERNEILQGFPGFNPPAESFVHFSEIYVVNNTTMADLGTYAVTLNPSLGQRIPDQIHFTVNVRIGIIVSMILV